MERAGRFACLVDAASYFRRLHQVLRRARRSVFLVGWDFDSRVALVDEADAGGYPGRLGPLLDALARSNRELAVHVLCWDYSKYYALERELGLGLQLGWRTHRRVRFRFDSKHPLGGSHHQKLVVVDDALAFSGGIDVTARRWDTGRHAPGDARRRDPWGESYGPFHDVQALVSGDAAAALGRLVRERWERASRRRVPELAPLPCEELWPRDLAADLTDVPVAIARTRPAFGGLEPVREVERSLLESIRSARRSIYVENQYFTSTTVAEELARRLEERDGPDVVVVLPRHASGWLEERTMIPLTRRVLARLGQADRHGRLRVAWPAASRREDEGVFVHSKVLCIDDECLRIGSANLANRSMGLDTECDLLVLARTDEHRRAIRAVRDRLLAEHLGVEPGLAAAVLDSHRLAQAIDELGGGDRTLVPMEIPESAPDEPLLPVDPERPASATRAIDGLLGELRGGRRRVWPTVAWTLGVLVALVAAWRWRDQLLGGLDVERWAAALSVPDPGPLRRALEPFVVLVGFVVGTFLFLPCNLMILASVLVLGGLLGGAYALVGALAGALATYGAGRALGGARVRRLTRGRLDDLGRKLGSHGVTAVFLVRILPVAPATLVNVACGAAGVRLRDFALGTTLGLLPGVAGFALFGSRMLEALRDPSLGNVLALAGVAVLLVGAAAWIDRSVADHDVHGERHRD